MSFSNEQKEELRMKLLEEKERILHKLKDSKPGLDFGDDVDGFEEEADEAEEFANYLGVEQVEEDTVHDIDIAIDKMKEGTYGICEKCNNQISYELLSIRPESKWCKECKLEEHNK